MGILWNFKEFHKTPGLFEGGLKFSGELQQVSMGFRGASESFYLGVFQEVSRAFQRIYR